MQPRPDGPADPRGDQAGGGYYVPAAIEAAPGGSPARRVPAAEPAGPRGDQAGGGYSRAEKIEAAEFCVINGLGPAEYRIIERVARHGGRAGRADLEDARLGIDRLIAAKYPAAAAAAAPPAIQVGDVLFDPPVRATFLVIRVGAGEVDLEPRDSAGGTPRQSRSLGYVERNMDRVEVGPGPPATDAHFDYRDGPNCRVRVVGRCPGCVVAQFIDDGGGIVRKFDDAFFARYFRPAEPIPPEPLDPATGPAAPAPSPAVEVGDIYYDPHARATFRVSRVGSGVISLEPRDCAGGTPRQCRTSAYVARRMERIVEGPGPPATDAAYYLRDGRGARFRVVGRCPGHVIAQVDNGDEEGTVRRFDDEFFADTFILAEPTVEELLDAAGTPAAAAAAEPAPPMIVVGAIWARKDHPGIEYRVCGIRDQGGQGGRGGSVSIQGVLREGPELVADGPTYPITVAQLRQLYAPITPGGPPSRPLPDPAPGPEAGRVACRRCEREGPAGTLAIFADGICRDCHQASDPRPGMRLVEHQGGAAYRVDSVDPRRGVAIMVAVDPQGDQTVTADLGDIAAGFRVDPDRLGPADEAPIAVGSRWQREFGTLDSPHLQVVGFRGRDPLVRLDADAFDRAARRVSRDYLLRCYEPEVAAHA